MLFAQLGVTEEKTSLYALQACSWDIALICFSSPRQIFSSCASVWAKYIYTNQDRMGFIPTSEVLAQSCDSQTRSPDFRTPSRFR